MDGHQGHGSHTAADRFDIKEWQLESGPQWLTTDRFDFNATAGGEATQAEYRAMLRSLLIARFGLKTHMETRQMPASPDDRTH